MSILDFAAAKLERTPHAAGQAQCMDCKHEWAAVAPVGVVALDCPQCSSPRGRFKYEFSADEGDALFTCNCGSTLYSRVLRKSGREHWLCTGCGVEPVI